MPSPPFRTTIPLVAIALAIVLQPTGVIYAQLLPPAVNDALTTPSGKDSKAQAAYNTIRNRLADFIEENKRPGWDDSAPPESLDTAGKLGAKIEQLDRAETIGAFIRHTAEFVLRYPDHPQFADRLWRLTVTADLAERAKRPLPLAKPLAPMLIKSADLLPDGHGVRLEAQFLAARRHHQEGEFDDEERVLRGLVANGDATEAMRFTALSLLGRSFETRGEFDSALELYREGMANLPIIPGACDTTLRAALIHLEHGRRGKALQLLKELGDTDPALRKLAASAAELSSILPLLEDKKALNAYWDYSETWWPAWLALREKFGDTRPADEIRAGLGASGDNAKLELARIAARKDKERFLDRLDLHMHALRWIPGSIDIAGSSLCFLATRMFPDQEDDIYAAVREVCGAFPQADRRASRSAQIFQTIALSEADDSKGALAAIEAFRADDPEPDDQSDTMTRMWAHLALAGETELEGPLEALEALVGAPRELENRAQSVYYLAQIYRKLDRHDDERTLLEEQIKRPDLLADEQLAKALKSRLEELANGGTADSDDGFATAVAEWHEKFAPGWLKFALPKGLEDPRLKDKTIGELVEDRESLGLSTEEVTKLELLAAADDRIPPSGRDLAFRNAFAGLYGDAPTHSEARKMLRGVLRDDRFPNQLQQTLLIFSLDEALSNGRNRDITNVLTHPILDRENPRLAAAVQAYGRFSSTDIRSAESLIELYDELAEGRIGGAEFTVLLRVFEAMLEIGELDAAEAAAQKISDWDLDAEVAGRRNAVKLALIKGLRRAKAVVPFAKKMRAMLLEKVDIDALTTPGLVSDYRDEFDLKQLPDAEAFALLATRAARSDTLPTAPQLWVQLVELMPRDEKQVAFAFDFLEAVLTSEIPDLEKSFTVLSTPSLIDTDDAGLLKRMLELFEKYRDPKDQPYTNAVMRIVETQSRDLRQGKPTDFDAAWAGLDHPALDNILTSSKLRHLMALREVAKLRRELDRLPADRLLSVDLLDLTWPAFEMADMKDEAELAREASLENLPAFIAGAARRLDFGLIRMVHDTAKRVGQSELVPDGLIDYLATQIKAERDLCSLHIIDAEFKEDWKTLAEWAGRAVKDFPSYYNYYRPYGIALHQLGRDAEAIKALEVYTKYSKDEVDWQEAIDLLEQLKKEAPSESE